MTKKNLIYIGFFLAAILLLATIFVTSLPVFILTNYLGLQINHPDNLKAFLIKVSVYFLVLLIMAAGYLIFRKSNWIANLCKKISSYILLVIDQIKADHIIPILLIYIISLSVVSAVNYDLGFDEAWYLHYSKNFKNLLFPFFTINDNVSFIDVITMLPYYLGYLIFGEIFPISLIGVKVLSLILSLLGLFIIYRVISSNDLSKVSIISILFMVLQPGFGFVASSFFGEILAIGILFFAAHLLFNKQMVWLSSFLFALSIHTKFQLLPIILLPFLTSILIKKDVFYFKVIFRTILIAGIIALIRLIPVLLHDPSNIISIIKQFYFLSSSYNKGFAIHSFERFQLYNRFFPLGIFLFIFMFTFPLLKTKFERYIFAFTIFMNFYWLLFFRFVTYRHLYMGIIPACYLLAKFMFYLMESFKQKLAASKSNQFKILIIFSTLIFVIYGASTNLIYALIGYNDGVQFDLDGYQNRLFTKVERDDSQKMFYSEIRDIIRDDAIIFTPSPHLSKFFLNNKIYSFDKINSISEDKDKYIIISREFYPGDIEKGFKEIQISKVHYNIIHCTGDFCLLKITESVAHE